MNAFKVCYNGSMRFERKPNQYDAAMISDRLPNNPKEVDMDKIKSFVNLVSKEGVPFCPATFINDERKKDSFKQQQLFALDFDNDKNDKQVSFQDIKKRADEYHLPILFAYDTFNSISHNKFRIAFLNDASVPHRKTAEVMINALHTIFPEADPSCKDVSRMFYGGKHLLHFDDTVPAINIVSTIVGMTKYLEDEYGKTNYKKKVTEFNRNNYIVPNNKGMPGVSVADELPRSRDFAENIGVMQNDKNSPEPSISIEGFGDNLLKRYYLIKFHNENTNISANKKTLKNHAEYRSAHLKEIRSVCQLFREFETGERRLHHMELFGLATNLTKVETGQKLFLDTFQNNSYSENRSKGHDYWNHQLKNYITDYSPQSCDKFCPYNDSCAHAANIISTSKVKYHQIERLANYEETLYSVEEASEDFRQKFLQAMNADDAKWHIIKAQTAIGKTETYLKLIRDTTQRVLIAVPTNKLKYEVQKRASDMGIEIIESPSLHEFKDDLPDHVWDYIQNLYNSGRSVVPYLKKIIATDDPECTAIFKQYLRKLDEFNDFAGHAITTHRRFLTIDVEKYDLVIVDEDIIFSTVIPNKTDISISNLKRLQKSIPPNTPLARKVRQVFKCMKGDELFTLPEVHFDRNDDDGKPMGVDLPSFAAAVHFCFRKASDRDSNLSEDCISYFNPVQLDKKNKCIMVSATADETICEYALGADNMEFYDCKRARYRGIINQYHDKSMSRADIKKDPAIIDRIKKWSGFKHTITFKKYSRGDLHFGNTAGCDHLKGEDIDVIGTPHQPEWIYKLFAYSLSLDFDTDAIAKPGTTVVHNGCKFRFRTYNDIVLRSIQFYLIESELEQAVGRARLLRQICTVNLFSNFPLGQANLMKSKYGEDDAANET